MTAFNDLNAILERIAAGIHTEEDIVALRCALVVSGEQNVVQLGKYNINISQGQDIQIGDRTYEGLSAEAIREVITVVLDEYHLHERDPIPSTKNIGSKKKKLARAFLSSVVITCLLLGVKSLGILEEWELKAYDHLIQLRPDEKPDPRLLIITVTENDIQVQKPEQRKGSLSDTLLDQLLEKLEPYKPRVIGLDIYRDFPVDSKYIDLEKRLRQNNNFIAVCEVGSTDNSPSISPPPEIPAKRLGFTDIPVDRDGVIRRQLLGMAPGSSPCNTPYSFSFQVALSYLAKKNINSKRSPGEDLQIGKTVFKKFEADTGGYQQEDARGYQVLLNYRSSQNVAQQVTLAEVLSDQFNPDWVKDRIVLIGTTARSMNDYFYTPYRRKWEIQEMPGIVIHTQMVSQILSAILDRRCLLWVWPNWAETLWIWSWSLVGSLLPWQGRSLLVFGIMVVATIGILYGICFVMLVTSCGWIPIVPSALAFTFGCGVVFYTELRSIRQDTH